MVQGGREPQSDRKILSQTENSQMSSADSLSAPHITHAANPWPTSPASQSCGDLQSAVWFYRGDGII